MPGERLLETPRKGNSVGGPERGKNKGLLRPLIKTEKLIPEWAEGGRTLQIVISNQSWE